jgi:flagellar hook-basal body complex protein FliE
MVNAINSYNSIMDRYNSMINIGDSSSVGKSGDQETANQVQGSFEDLLSSQINKLNDSQVQADNLIQDFAAGKTDDLHQVMIASQEASLSLELAVQIRNKIVDSYKELNNMQL